MYFQREMARVVLSLLPSLYFSYHLSNSTHIVDFFSWISDCDCDSDAAYHNKEGIIAQDLINLVLIEIISEMLHGRIYPN